MNRAIRRHHRERVREKRRRIPWVRAIEELHGPERIGKYIDTPHPCSCRCCGHRRQWEGPTIQERRYGGTCASY